MAGTNQDSLREVLREKGWDAPDLSKIDEAYTQLRDYLHEETLRPRQQNGTNLPVVYTEKAGTFRMGIPARDAPLKVVVFGTVSPTIYHDLIWEQIQKIPEYKSSRAGVYEVQKLPNLRFIVHLGGYDFDWTYYQTTQLLRSYHDEFLKTPERIVVNLCGESIAELIQQLQEQSEINVALAPARDHYHAARAWAVIHGINDEQTETAIAASLSNASEVSAAFDQIFRETGKPRLRDIEDESWVQILEASAQRSLFERFLADRHLVIKVMHTGCSNTQATAWFQYIEGRLPLLGDNLRMKVRTAQNMKLSAKDRSSRPPQIKFYNGRLVHESAVSETSSYYEGCYIIGLRISDAAFDALHDELQATVERWLATAERHESTISGKCFISHEFLSLKEMSQQESQLGRLTACQKPNVRVFLPAPIAVSNTDAQETITSASPSLSTQPLDAPQSTTSKLRTASDIHNRLLHDSSFNIDEFVIGYVDRFSPVPLEMRAADWDRVKEHEAFIPESRIRYFKRRWKEGCEEKEELVWDRGTRVDKVFWSGNSAGREGSG